MRDSWAWWPIFSALVVSSLPAVAHGQVAPNSPVHVTVNGVFYICPAFVRAGGAPPGTDLSGFGFTAETGNGPDKQRFKGVVEEGLLDLSYEVADQRCILNYGGTGYEAIAGIVRDTVTRNGLKRLSRVDNGRTKLDLFERPVPKGNKTARIIIVENYAQPSATISYTER